MVHMGKILFVKIANTGVTRKLIQSQPNVVNSLLVKKNKQKKLFLKYVFSFNWALAWPHLAHKVVTPLIGKL